MDRFSHSMPMYSDKVKAPCTFDYEECCSHPPITWIMEVQLTT